VAKEEEADEDAFPSEEEIRKAFPKLDSGKAHELAEALEAAFAENADEDAVDEAMETADEILGGHGVEGIQGEGAFIDKYWRDTILLYVNLGDTYDTTICYDTEEEAFFIGSWGDFYEKWSNEDDEEEGDEEEGEEEEEEEEAEEEEGDDETEGEEEEEEVEENGE